MKEKSPSEPAGPEAVLTVSVTVAPPVVGIFVEEEKEDVASEGRPDTLIVSAGMVPVDPETKLRVTVYMPVVPRKTAWLGATPMEKS